MVSEVEAPVADELVTELVEAGKAEDTAVSGTDREGGHFQNIEDGDGGDKNDQRSSYLLRLPSRTK